MVGTISAPAPDFDALQARMASFNKQAAGKVDDLFAQARADDRVKDGQKALGYLDQAAEQLRLQRRAGAADKVAQLKKELELLRLFPLKDPRQAAREAARIAHDLAAAAWDYVAGGGSAASGPPPGTTDTAASQAPPADQAAGAPQAADIAAPADDAKAELDFAAEVRLLLTVARALFEQARRRLSANPKDDEASALDRQVSDAEAKVAQVFSEPLLSAAAAPVGVAV